MKLKNKIGVLVAICLIPLFIIPAFASEKADGAILVRIFGDKFDFSPPVYQMKSDLIRFEYGNGDSIHRYSSDGTIDELFKIIGLTLTDECYVFQSQQGQRDFCTDDNFSLKFYINHQQVDSILDYIIQEDDRILISYGNETPEEIQSQLLELESIEIKSGNNIRIYVSQPAGIGFYSNELYDFSFEAPTDWRYNENIPNPDGTVTQLMIFPEGFNPLYDIGTPNIIVFFENIPESKVRYMSGQAFEKYHTEQIMSDKFTGARIISIDSEDKSWGWVISTDFIFSQSFGYVAEQYHTEQRAFHFKDREAYTVAYFATDEYFDAYYPVYEHVLDTMVIKSVKVPEFQEIAMVVLAGSIVLVIVFARKFKVMKILNS